MELQNWMIFKSDEPYERVDRRSADYVSAHVDWLNEGHWNKPYTYALLGETVDQYACGITLVRGSRVIAQMPYGEVECTYLYPSLGVSSLTNAIVKTSHGAVQIPASLLREVTR